MAENPLLTLPHVDADRALVEQELRAAVAAPTEAMTPPDRGRSATWRARVQATDSRPRRMEPSQAKLNWQPLARAAPWKTTPQTLLG